MSITLDDKVRSTSLCYFYSISLLALLCETDQRNYHIGTSAVGFLLVAYNHSMPRFGYPYLILPGSYPLPFIPILIYNVGVIMITAGGLSIVYLMKVEFQRCVHASDAGLRMAKEVSEKLAQILRPDLRTA